MSRSSKRRDLEEAKILSKAESAEEAAILLMKSGYMSLKKKGAIMWRMIQLAKGESNDCDGN